jgi:signal transduction histidine kinase
MLEFLKSFLVSGPFIPHGHCYLWRLNLVWLHLISDALIALSYYSIPATLVYFVRKRQDLPFNWIFILFGIFIVACGTTHIMEIWTLWYPTYWLSGFIKVITAVASVYTAVVLVELIPQALAFPSPAQLEAANRVLQEQVMERLRVETALQMVNDQLEIRVEARTTELKNANQQLRSEIGERKRAEAELHNALEKEKELSELKSRFVTIASHEFRTPLATILSSTELIERYSHKWSEEKKLTHFQRIQVSIKHMTGLLNDVLLIGKVEASKLDFMPTPLDLVQFCRDLVEDMQFTTATHTIVFSTQAQFPNACMDEKLLQHILSNLLSNAIKYSPQCGTVHFNLVCEQDKAVFRIQDEGIGIPVTEQNQLFDSFYRASNVGTISGTGLGLAIVKKSVDLHGGNITVDSEVGVGTTFSVMLPLKK